MNARKDLNVDSGFMAGTLVHTKEGLVPIAQIKVGDMVLSQDEQTGERAYKPVTRTFAHQKQPICKLNFVGVDDEVDNIYMTANHPVRVVHQDLDPKGRWVDAEYLSRWDEIVLANGPRAFIDRWEVAYRWTREPRVGWSKDFWLYNPWCNESISPPMSEGHILEPIDASIPTDYGYAEGDDSELIPFTADVFNIEVADFHTYFVDRYGLWVHNKNPVKLELFNGRGELPPSDISIYPSGT